MATVIYASSVILYMGVGQAELPRRVGLDSIARRIVTVKKR
tara:strand:- start:83800 stop:83922 length:123 start_codon:yes stop_codon:yes gene_type:complete